MGGLYSRGGLRAGSALWGGAWRQLFSGHGTRVSAGLLGSGLESRTTFFGRALADAAERA